MLSLVCGGALAFRIGVGRTKTSRPSRITSTPQPTTLDDYEPLGDKRTWESHGGCVARHRTARHLVIMRRLRPRVQIEELARIERDLRTLSRLKSTHTAAVYGCRAEPDGTLLYVRELVDGVGLDDVVRLTGPMPPSRVVQVLLQACDSLSEAHAAGILHRAITPAKVFLCRRPRADSVKVVDFGLNALAGTPAPDTIRTSSKQLDAKADVAQLADVASWMLTGRRLLDEATATHVPQGDELAELFRRCRHADPSHRPTCAELAQALREVGTARPWTLADAEAWWEVHGHALAPRVRCRDTAPD